MAHIARTYLVSNPTALFGPGRRITFTSAAPTGSVILLKVDGRTVRVQLTGDPLNGGLLRADLLFNHL